MKKIFFLVFFVLTFASLTFATQKSKIDLTDGSTLDGEVISVEEGVYTIKSPSLGALKIEESKIRAIRSADPTAAIPAVGVSAVSQKDITSLDATTIQNEVGKIQPAIASNPDIMKAIPGLLSNPDFQALLKDPEIVNAAKSMDVKALMANEKFVKIINDPTIQEISQKIKGKKIKETA